MKTSKIADLRREWDSLPGERLEEMLALELEKPEPDDEKVLLLLHILEGREPEGPLSLTPGEEEALSRYQQRIRERTEKAEASRGWRGLAAALILISVLLFALFPQRVQAENLWAMLTRWGESILQFWAPEETILREEYTFRTDNPGLRQVYDAVTEMGITDPVVPMWIPEGYELVTLEKENTPNLEGLYVGFSDEEKCIVYKVEVFSNISYHEYYRDDQYDEMYEIEGVTFNITRNNDWWTVVWTKENIECSIFVDCQEDALRRILDSIYTMEDD